MTSGNRGLRGPSANSSAVTKQIRRATTPRAAARAEMMFPGKGDALMSAWRARQFEYTWLRTLGGAYADFWQTTREALIFATGSPRLTLTHSARDSLTHTYLELEAWNDVRPALEALRAAGVRMAFLSNFTATMLEAATANSGLQGFFERHLSTDRVRAFKPDRRAYAMGPQALRLRSEEILLCAAAGWDAAGAKWFGYPTFWVNRSHQRAEERGVRADGVGTGMARDTARTTARCRSFRRRLQNIVDGKLCASALAPKRIRDLVASNGCDPGPDRCTAYPGAALQMQGQEYLLM
jgi:2-haloacid dehalogenase